MTLEENITAILGTYFSGFRDEQIEACSKRIMEQIKRNTDDAYALELMDAVTRGEMSDARANQAYYEYISKEVEESDTPHTERSRR